MKPTRPPKRFTKSVINVGIHPQTLSSLRTVVSTRSPHPLLNAFDLIETGLTYKGLSLADIDHPTYSQELPRPGSFWRHACCASGRNDRATARSGLTSVTAPQLRPILDSDYSAQRGPQPDDRQAAATSPRFLIGRVLYDSGAVSRIPGG
jgi:hypothetical protein